MFLCTEKDDLRHRYLNRYGSTLGFYELGMGSDHDSQTDKRTCRHVDTLEQWIGVGLFNLVSQGKREGQFLTFTLFPSFGLFRREEMWG